MEIVMLKINKSNRRISLKSLNFFLISIFILTLPYYINSAWIGTFSILIFLLSLFISYSAKDLFSITYIKYLAAFILYSFLSFIWSDSLANSFSNFKYFPLIIVGFYFSKLSNKQVRFLLILLILSPIIYLFLNYTNSFQLTNIYSFQYNYKCFFCQFLIFDLGTNIFLIISSIAVFILFFKSLNSNNYRFSLIYLLLASIITLSLVIDARTESRMADIAFIVAFIYVSFKLLSLKQFSIAFLIVMSIAYIGFSNNISVKQKFEKIYIDIEASLYNNNHNSSVGFRSGMILIGFEILKDNFWLGTGDINLEKKIDSIRKQSPDKFGKTIHRIKSFHNDHITLLVTYGVIGYGLFLLFIYKFFMFSLGNLYMDIFKNAIILTYLSLMMGYEYITDKTNGVLFALIIALFTVYVINKKVKRKI
jgi:hypothetical protein